MVQLAATAEGKRQARRALLALLVGQADGWAASELVAGIVQLSPTAQDKRQARKALLAFLAGPAKGLLASRLVDDLAQLDPAARDIRAWRAWHALPTVELLAAVRRKLGCCHLARSPASLGAAIGSLFPNAAALNPRGSVSFER